MRPCGVRRLWVIIESQVIEVFFRRGPYLFPGGGEIGLMLPDRLGFSATFPVRVFGRNCRRIAPGVVPVRLRL